MSKQISLLEKEWGFTLFERSYRSVKLTASGQIMLNLLNQHMEEYEEGLRQAKRKSKEFTMELRLGLPECANIGNLSEVLMGFQAEHPNVILKVRYAALSELELSEDDNDFDLVVNYARNLRGKNYLDTKTLGTRRHMAMVSKNHPAVQKEHPVFEDLARERLYVPVPNSNSNLTRDYAIFICNNHGFTPPTVESLPNIESTLMAVKMGMGFVVLDDLLDLPSRFQLIGLPTNVNFKVKLAWKRNDQNPMTVKLAEYIYENLTLPDV